VIKGFLFHMCNVSRVFYPLLPLRIESSGMVFFVPGGVQMRTKNTPVKLKKDLYTVFFYFYFFYLNIYTYYREWCTSNQRTILETTLLAETLAYGHPGVNKEVG
jgi:hypothetical protein